MLNKATLLGLALLVMAPIALGDTPEQLFYQQLNSDISSANFQQGGSALPDYYPAEAQRPEGIQG